MSPSKQLSTFRTSEFLCGEKMYLFFSHCRSSSLLPKDENNHTVERALQREQSEPETIQGTARAVSAFGAYQFPEWRFSNIQVGLGKLYSSFNTLIYQFCGPEESPKWVPNGRDHFGVGNVERNIFTVVRENSCNWVFCNNLQSTHARLNGPCLLSPAAFLASAFWGITHQEQATPSGSSLSLPCWEPHLQAPSSRSPL